MWLVSRCDSCSDRTLSGRPLTLAIDAQLRRIGTVNLEIMQGALEALALYPIVGRGIATMEQFRDLVEAAREELERTEVEPYVTL